MTRQECRARSERKNLCVRTPHANGYHVADDGTRVVERWYVGRHRAAEQPKTVIEMARELRTLLRTSDEVTDALWDLHIAAGGGRPLSADAAQLITDVIELAGQLVEAQLAAEQEPAGLTPQPAGSSLTVRMPSRAHLHAVGGA